MRKSHLCHTIEGNDDCVTNCASDSASKLSSKSTLFFFS
uniref:Uncharacterized protein n=1 Tax=Parascaris equorum TaxID=6256 RepID=A0A914SJ50_PAREQ